MYFTVKNAARELIWTLSDVILTFALDWVSWPADLIPPNFVGGSGIPGHEKIRLELRRSLVGKWLRSPAEQFSVYIDPISTLPIGRIYSRGRPKGQVGCWGLGLDLACRPRTRGSFLLESLLTFLRAPNRCFNFWYFSSLRAVWGAGLACGAMTSCSGFSEGSLTCLSYSFYILCSSLIACWFESFNYKWGASYYWPWPIRDRSEPHHFSLVSILLPWLCFDQFN